MSIPYGSVVLEHYRRPRNHRALPAATVSREEFNPLCGDRVRIELAVQDGIVREAAFTANACAICTASASLLTERIVAMPVADALAIPNGEVVSALETDLPAGRIPCAVLPAVAMRGALAAVATA